MSGPRNCRMMTWLSQRHSTLRHQVNGEDLSSVVDRLAGMYGFVQSTLIFEISFAYFVGKYIVH